MLSLLPTYPHVVLQVKYRDPFTLEESTFSDYDCDAYYTTHSTAMAGCSVPRSLVGHTATGAYPTHRTDQINATCPPSS